MKSRLGFLRSDGKGVHTRTQGQEGEGDSGQEKGAGDRWTDTGVVLASTDPLLARSGRQVHTFHSCLLLRGLDRVKDKQNALWAFFPSVLAVLWGELAGPCTVTRSPIHNPCQQRAHFSPAVPGPRHACLWLPPSLQPSEKALALDAEADPLQSFAQNHLLMATLRDPPPLEITAPHPERPTPSLPGSLSSARL